MEQHFDLLVNHLLHIMAICYVGRNYFQIIRYIYSARVFIDTSVITSTFLSILFLVKISLDISKSILTFNSAIYRYFVCIMKTAVCYHFRSINISFILCRPLISCLYKSSTIKIPLCYSDLYMSLK